MGLDYGENNFTDNLLLGGEVVAYVIMGLVAIVFSPILLPLWALGRLVRTQQPKGLRGRGRR
jgi:hypothetical protein